MGYVLQGDELRQEKFGAEVRSESFYLYGHKLLESDHRIFVYPDTPNGVLGMIEIRLVDIPELRKALDAIEDHARGNA